MLDGRRQRQLGIADAEPDVFVAHDGGESGAGVEHGAER